MSNAQPCAEKVLINLNAPPMFQLRQRILGEDNANLQFIVQETKAKVTLRGKGSGLVKQNGADSNEPLHLYIEHPALKNLIEAKNLAKNLIETIQSELQLFLNPTQQGQQAVQIQQPPPVMQTGNQQFLISPAGFSCPPPTIIHQPTHIIQQQSFIPQHQILPQNVPMQIVHQAPPPTAGVPVRTTAPIVQFQGQTVHQIQGAAGGQQILLNQAPTQQYQLQYIPSTNQITSAAPMQTIQQAIQHIIQPQQQFQGIIQPGSNGQQFITVQGNTSFMSPPPCPTNIIQQNQQQNINASTVYNTQPTVLTMSQEELQNDPKLKQDENNDMKNQQKLQQLAARIITHPPPFTGPPPQGYQQQQGPQQQIQQFIVNGNQVWSQQQQIQQIPMNSQIQIVTQPQTIRTGNDLVLQQNPTGQQVITTFNPQQSGQQQFQQIQFHQATIAQPQPQQQQPQMQVIQPNHQSISYQQQFEQKINQTNDIQHRAVKRKFDGELEADPVKLFPKMGVGQSSGEGSAQSNTRLVAANSQGQQQSRKLTVSFPGTVVSGGSGDSRSNQNISTFPRNIASTSGTQKNVVPAAEPNMKPKANENESNEASDSSQFMIRTNNQSYRFQAPQNFVHQQPPPMGQNTQRGQIMSSSNINMYQHLSQLIQQPPPGTHQFVQQDVNVYQQNNNYHVNGQQGNLNRFNGPQQQSQQQQQAPIISNDANNGSVQQQQRFRQQQQQW